MPNLQLIPVSKEIAIRLKQKGFDLRTEMCYRGIIDDKPVYGSMGTNHYNSADFKNTCSAPSLDLALIWLEGKGFQFCAEKGKKCYTVEVHGIDYDLRFFSIYNSTAFKEAQILMALDILDSETKK